MITRTSVKIIASAIIFAVKGCDIKKATAFASQICESVDAREEREAPDWAKNARAILMVDTHDPDALLSEE